MFARMLRASAAAMIYGGLLAASAVTANAETSNAVPLPPPYVLILDQKAEASSIVLKYIYMPVNGYVLVFPLDANGKPAAEPIGEVALKSGDHRDVKLTLKSEPAANTHFWAGIYEDKDGDGKYDPAKDVRYPDSGPEPGSNFFTVH